MCLCYLSHDLVTAERECFPTVLMSWIQMSNPFCFSVEWKIIKHKIFCVFVTWMTICHCCKSRLEISFSCVWAYELLKESVFQLFWCADQISSHFCFWLSGRSWNIKPYVFLLLEPWFGHCCKVIWKLVSDVFEHMNYWKKWVFQLFWCAESKYQIIFAFGWVEDHKT